METRPSEAPSRRMPLNEDGEIEEGEIQESHDVEPNSCLTSERGLTSDPRERRTSTSPAPSWTAPSQRRTMSRRHRTGRDRRESYRERDHFSRSYSSGTSSAYRTERACLHERQCLVHEIVTLTKRGTSQDAPKAMDVVCHELKVAARKLERLRRLVSKSRSDLSDVTECAHRVFAGLRAVHMACASNSGPPQKLDAVKDVLRFALHYRHILFGLSQKRDLEDWIREAEASYLREPEHREASRERSASQFSVPRPPNTDAPKIDAAVSVHSLDNPFRNEGTQTPRAEPKGTQATVGGMDRPLSCIREGLSHGDSAETAPPLPLKDPSRTPESKRGRWVEVCPGTRSQAVHDTELHSKTIPVDAKKAGGASPVTTDARFPESQTIHSRESEELSREAFKKPRREEDDRDALRSPAEMDLDTEVQDEARLTSTDASFEALRPQRVERNWDSSMQQEGAIQHTELAPERPTDSLKTDSTGPESLEDGAQREERPMQITPERSLRCSQPSPLGLKPVRYTATEANEIDERDESCRQSTSHSRLIDLSIPPPPPPLIFKPKPVSPDVTFDPQPDSYWESLLYDVPLLRTRCCPEGVCVPLLEGKMCLLLDLDTVLFSTTHFSELDADSEQLLHSCLENETHLPFFARSLHCIPRLNLWVKLRPGLNKFLRIAKSAFWLYGHTHRSKEEMERLLKLFDPEGWIPTHHIFYDTFAGESIYKKVHRLRPALQALRPVTVILSDACLRWEDMDAVLGIESYFFFPSTKARFGLTSPSMFETRSDEEDCGFLLNALDILLQLRQRTLERVADPKSSSAFLRHSQYRLPKLLGQLRPWDARRIMAETRMSILSGVHIYFDRVLSPKEPHEQQLPWRMATSMGALCSATHSDRTTHVITLPGSPKA